MNCDGFYLHITSHKWPNAHDLIIGVPTIKIVNKRNVFAM